MISPSLLPPLFYIHHHHEYTIAAHIHQTTVKNPHDDIMTLYLVGQRLIFNFCYILLLLCGEDDGVN